MSETAYPPLGRVSAHKVQVPDAFIDTVSGLVKRRSLTLAQLRQAA